MGRMERRMLAFFSARPKRVAGAIQDMLSKHDRVKISCFFSSASTVAPRGDKRPLAVAFPGSHGRPANLVRGRFLGRYPLVRVEARAATVKKRNVGGRTEPIGTDLSRLARPVEKGMALALGRLAARLVALEQQVDVPKRSRRYQRRSTTQRSGLAKCREPPSPSSGRHSWSSPSIPTVPAKAPLAAGPPCLPRSSLPDSRTFSLEKPPGWLLSPSHVMPLRQDLVELRKFDEELVCLHP